MGRVGTEVRKKRGNWLIGELLKPGDKVTVAKGGLGGVGVVAPSREQKINKAERARARAASAQPTQTPVGLQRKRVL
jgi:GTPase involved in cell partitioning and DNA repair